MLLISMLQKKLKTCLLAAIKNLEHGYGNMQMYIMMLSNDIIHYEDMGKTVVEGDASLAVSQKFIELAKMLINEAVE